MLFYLPFTLTLRTRVLFSCYLLSVTRPHMNLFFTCEDNYTNLVGLSLKIKENLCAVSGTQLPKGAVFC